MNCGSLRAHWIILLTLTSGARVTAQAAPAPAQDAKAKAYEFQMGSDQQAHPTLDIGASAPDFDLPCTDDRQHRLAEYHASPILAIVFISNHCPASQLYEGIIKAIPNDYKRVGVQVVAIVPNGPGAVGPAASNFTDVDDSSTSGRHGAPHAKRSIRACCRPTYGIDRETLSLFAWP